MLLGLVSFYVSFFIYLYRRALRLSLRIAEPLCEIERMAREIGEGQFEPSLPEVQVLEFQSLVRQMSSTGLMLQASENKLRETQTLAEQSSHAKSVFLANMSHEIRTPMSGIIGLVRLALSENIDTKMRENLQKILGSANSLLSILNNILEVSKIETGRIEIIHKPFSLKSLIVTIRNLFEHYANAKGLNFSIQVAEDFPSELIGDVFRLQQVLSDLLGNAIKFTERGEVELLIELVDRDDTYVDIKFSVRDTGCGIPEDKLNTIFQPFKNFEFHLEEHDGVESIAGLGLAISQSLLKMMNSSLALTSKLGSGSVFSFDLRLGLVSADLLIDAREPIADFGLVDTALIKNAAILPSARILVVEDNLVNQMVLKRYLQFFGFRVEVADNGREALDILAVERFDAVLMDIHMPVMDGLEATRSIRLNNCYRELPVIAVSAGFSVENMAKYEAIGLNDFIAKPIEPSVLLDVLRRHLKSPVIETVPNMIEDIPKQAQSPVIDIQWSDLASSLPGYDLADIRVMFDDDWQDYFEMLDIFYKDCLKEVPLILRLIDAGDLAQAQLVLHKFKGMAGNLGARRLFEVSQVLDDHLKCGRLDRKVLDNWVVMNDINRLALKSLLEITVVEKTVESVGDVDLRESIASLSRMLEDNDFIESVVVENIKRQLPAAQFFLFDQLENHIKRYDYDNALLVLKIVVKQLNLDLK